MIKYLLILAVFTVGCAPPTPPTPSCNLLEMRHDLDVPTCIEEGGQYTPSEDEASVCADGGSVWRAVCKTLIQSTGQTYYATPTCIGGDIVCVDDNPIYVQISAPECFDVCTTF